MVYSRTPWNLPTLILIVALLKWAHVCGNPTIITYSPFNASVDAAILRSAMNQVGTDEQKIISIVTKRTLKQRLQIISEYDKRFKMKLETELKMEVGGNLFELLHALFQTKPAFYAESIHKAVSRFGPDDQALIDQIFCCLETFKIDKVGQDYKKQYSRDLKVDVKKDVSGDYATLLEALIQGKRRNSTSFHKNVNNSIKIAKELVKTGRKGSGIWLGSEVNPIIKTFSECSYKELAEISNEYLKLTNRPLATLFKSKSTGNFQSLLLKILSYAESPINHFALILKSALEQTPNVNLYKDIHRCRAVIRVLVTRSEVDLMDIEERYSVTANKSLAADVKAATVSYFQKACLNIIRGNR
ncbi:unnamed protein product [Orchesella dallaii]|uniref:Annexin n=1 Tax=Orchesella dallaii TaxID=48710 RepID=A0ABP1RAM7_9HEXA